MLELCFAYRVRLDFDPPVEKHRFTLKCTPRSDRRQAISDLSIRVFPNEFLSNYVDSFGNACIYGSSEALHDHFSIEVTGTARTGLSPWEEAEDGVHVGPYKYQSAYTAPGPALRAFARTLPPPPGQPPLERAAALMTALHGAFVYAKGATDIHTTAEQAMALGRGVCQDYAHILLSLCRMEAIPARYVVGMLMGEGSSHAWVEVCDGGRWYALDPTNDLVVDDQHIKISAGRDYKDCIVDQGVFTGRSSRQSQTVSVTVGPAVRRMNGGEQ